MNDYYSETGAPSTSSAGDSATMRSEFALISDGFDKLPALSGNGSKVVAINSGGTAMEALSTTGSGNIVRATSPTLVTPTLGVATATSINGLSLTASTGTFTLSNGKTLTVSNTLTFTATDGATLAIGAGGTLGSAAYTATTAYEAAGAIATHAALQNVHGLNITAGQTLTVTTGGTLGSAAYTASTAYLAAAGTAANSSQLLGKTWASPDPIGTGTPAAGTFTTVSDSKGNVRELPLNSQSGAYIIASSDVGKIISNTTGGITLNTGTLTSGQAVSIFNDSGSSQTITQGGGVTMYLAGTATTGNRTLAQRGICTITCVGSEKFVISGGGLT